MSRDSEVEHIPFWGNLSFTHYYSSVTVSTWNLK